MNRLHFCYMRDLQFLMKASICYSIYAATFNVEEPSHVCITWIYSSSCLRLKHLAEGKLSKLALIMQTQFMDSHIPVYSIAIISE